MIVRTGLSSRSAAPSVMNSGSSRSAAPSVMNSGMYVMNSGM
jgi:hypothetical protein